MKVTSSKDPAEIVDVSFEFTAELGAETITPLSPVVTVALVSGVDADPSAILQGAASIVGGVVLQRVRQGVDKCDYHMRCVVDTDSGRRLVRSLVLPVRAI